MVAVGMQTTVTQRFSAYNRVQRADPQPQKQLSNHYLEHNLIIMSIDVCYYMVTVALSLAGGHVLIKIAAVLGLHNRINMQ